MTESETTRDGSLLVEQQSSSWLLVKLCFFKNPTG